MDSENHEVVAINFESCTNEQIKPSRLAILTTKGPPYFTHLIDPEVTSAKFRIQISIHTETMEKLSLFKLVFNSELGFIAVVLYDEMIKTSWILFFEASPGQQTFEKSLRPEPQSLEKTR